MAKFTIVFALAFLALSAQAARQIHTTAASPGATKKSHLGPAPPPPVNEEEYALAPEPYPGFYKFVDSCLLKLTEKCGNQIFGGIIEGSFVISRNCCGELVDMGRLCHTEVLKATTFLPFVTSEKKKKTMEKNDAEVWNECVAMVAS